MKPINLPKDIDAEKAIFSLILNSSQQLIEVVDLLKSSDFDGIYHQQIWQAITELFQQGQDIDVVSIRSQLSKVEKDVSPAMQTLVQCYESQVSEGNLNHFIKIVKNKSILRQIIRVTQAQGYSASMEGADASKVLRDLEKDILEVLDSTVDARSVDAEGIIRDINVDIQKAKKEGWLGYNTGFPKLDEKTGGLIPTQTWIIGGYTGQGKCLAKGTKVLMFNGDFKKVEDIKVGDLVMGVDSTPRKVLGLGNGKEEMFKVNPIKGEFFTVNKSHILSLKKTGTTFYNKKGKVIDISIENYLKKSKVFKHQHKLYRVGVNFKEKKVELSPYLLGLWLGDGVSIYPIITVAKNNLEVIKFLEKEAKRLNSELKIRQEQENCIDFAITGTRWSKGKFKEMLEKLNVLGNKHIPKIYKINSRKIRLEILAGLLDSDGYYNQGGFEFYNTNERLIDDVLFLVRSLGLAAYKKRYKAKGFNKIIDAFKVHISGDCSIIPVKVVYKKAKKRKQKKDVLVTGFKIESLGIGEYYGFTLDKDGLYLLSDFTVTHNTFLILQLLLNILREGAKVVLFSTEMDRKMNMLRFIGNISGLGVIDIIRGKLLENEEEYLKEAQAELRSYKDRLVIYDNIYSLSEIRLKAKKLKLTRGLDIIAVDFIQNLRGVESIYERMAEAAIGLQQMAQELNVIMIIGSQVSQSSAGWQNKEAIEFKGAGEIAAIADVAIWLAKVERDDKLREIIVRKIRHGERIRFDVKLEFPSGRVIDADLAKKQREVDNV